MSADNGIYILETADKQCRVREIFAVDNLNWSFITWDCDNELVSTRLASYFGNAKVMEEDKALKYAADLTKEVYTEYGINIIRDNRTWEEIISQSKELAPKEIEAINTDKDSYKWERDIEDLQKLIE